MRTKLSNKVIEHKAKVHKFIVGWWVKWFENIVSSPEEAEFLSNVKATIATNGTLDDCELEILLWMCLMRNNQCGLYNQSKQYR